MTREHREVQSIKAQRYFAVYHAEPALGQPLVRQLEVCFEVHLPLSLVWDGHETYG